MTIEYQHGHYVLVDETGEIYCTCDTHKEAMEEMEELQ